MTNNGLYSNAPRPRLCHLRRWPDFIGYGFNLHCEKAKPGQFIGKVDPDSPAESAGLRENDRIIEVNFVPIGTENHKQVVARIKEGVTRNGTKYPEEVILLVLDQDADEYYKSKSYVVRSSDANVQKLEAEIRDGSENGNDSPHSSNRSTGMADSHFVREPSPPPKPKESNRSTGKADSHFVREASPPPKPKEWNRSTGKADPHFVREESPPPKPKESNRSTGKADSHFVREESPPPKPKEWNRSTGKADSHFVREESPPPKPKESNRDYKHMTDFTSPTVANTKKTSSPAISRSSDHDDEALEVRETYHRPSPPASDKNKHKEVPPTHAYTNINSSPKPPTQDFHAKPTGAYSLQSPTTNGTGGILDMQMSAAEYREKIKAQNPRKRDPRHDQHMSMKEKHDLIDRL